MTLMPYASRPGVPRTALIALFPLEIIQTPRKIVIVHEYMGVFRLIPLNAKHPEDLEPTYMGDSVGHWEGDTLVVDVDWFQRQDMARPHRFVPQRGAACH